MPNGLAPPVLPSLCRTPALPALAFGASVRAVQGGTCDGLGQGIVFVGVATWSMRIVSSAGYPIEALNIMLPKEQTQLPSMFLNMAHRI